MTTTLKRDAAGKPIAPRKDWPLTANGNGQWSKKHKGHVYYFGRWDDHREAEQSYGRRWPSIVAGLGDPDDAAVAPTTAAHTLEAIANLYLTEQRAKLATFKISPSHFGRVRKELTMVLDFAGWRSRLPLQIKPVDWAKLNSHLEDRRGPDGRKHTIALVRSVARFARENGFSEAWTFGNALPIPSKAELRASRRDQDKEHGAKMFPQEQIRPILDACDMPVDAMFLLSINCGFTAADLAALPIDVLDLDNGWMMFDRVKTGVQRAGFLWPETVTALRQAIKHRPKVNAEKWAAARSAWLAAKPEGKEAMRRWQLHEPRWDSLVFITRFGSPWIRERIETDGAGLERAVRYDGVCLEFRKALEACDAKHPKGLGGMEFKRGRVSFGAGRHTFYTAARRIDAEAAQFVMGHADDSMGAWYDHLDDAKVSRLRDLSDALHARLMVPQTRTAAAFRFRPLRMAGNGGKAAGSA